MLTRLRIAAMVAAVLLMILPDMLDAQAGGRHRRTRRRTAVVVYSATKAQDQQAAEAQQQAAADQQAPADQQQAAAPGALPVGTIVPSLPDGCPPITVEDVQYYSCGGNWYRAAYQENNLVYVTTDPPQ